MKFPATNPVLGKLPLLNSHLALTPAVTAPVTLSRAAGNPAATAVSGGLFGVGVSAHDSLTSDVAMAFTALPHGIFAAGVPLHEIITSEVAEEMAAQLEGDTDE